MRPIAARCALPASAGAAYTGRSFLQIREVLFSELDTRHLLAAVQAVFALTELDTAYLAGDRLRQLGELQPANTAVGRHTLATEAEDSLRSCCIWLPAGYEYHVRLRHGQADRVGRGHNGGLGHAVMLDQNTLQLKRRDAVIRRLEDIVGATDIGDKAVRIARCHIPRVVVALAHHMRRAIRIVTIADHQAERASDQIEADLAFVSRLTGDRVEQRNAVARQRPAHRAQLQRLAWRVAHLRSCLGLPEPVTDGQAPGT